MRARRPVLHPGLTHRRVTASPTLGGGPGHSEEAGGGSDRPPVLDDKAREAQIVSEVLAMTTYPGGMSRDDYLRVRLQEARQSIYGAQSPPTTP